MRMTLRQRLHGTGPDPFGTGSKLVRIRSAVWYQMGPLLKVILHGTVPFQFRTGPV